MAGRKKTYNAKDSGVYHIYSNCSAGNNIETRNEQGGTGNKKLCEVCRRRRDAEKK